MIAVRMGAWDKKMLGNLGNKTILTTTKLFPLADKCVKAAESRD